jgi:hypothetical protein
MGTPNSSQRQYITSLINPRGDLHTACTGDHQHPQLARTLRWVLSVQASLQIARACCGCGSQYRSLPANTLLDEGSWLASKSDNLSESTQESQGGACVSPPLGTKRAKPLFRPMKRGKRNSRKVADRCFVLISRAATRSLFCLHLLRDIR